jgi:hypothetical protein
VPSCPNQGAIREATGCQQTHQTGITFLDLPRLNSVRVSSSLREAGYRIADGLVVLNPVVLGFEDNHSRHPSLEHLWKVQRQILTVIYTSVDSVADDNVRVDDICYNTIQIRGDI